MDYSARYLREFLPPGEPPAGAVPPEVAEEVLAWSGPPGAGDTDDAARATRWTYALFQEIALSQIHLSAVDDWLAGLGVTAPGAPLTIGLYDPDTERPGFGLCLRLPSSELPDFRVVSGVTFLRLGVSLPLALRQTAMEDHAPPHPQGATSACWAQCANTGLWGVLTAGHAIGGTRPGRAVPLAGGGQGRLVRSFHPPIDAAFVRTNAPTIPPPPLAIRRFPAAGQAVTIEAQSGAQSRTVIEAMDALGIVNTRSFAVLMFTDKPCAAGDSGALVRAAGGEAVGLYLGSALSPRTPNQPAGRVLNFEQATLALDITPHL
ncbi:hypothetical protein [Rhodospirillum rubrum]|uniref:Uncharacterized protein n=1 Tax=Rhodospirillum rubrum (strain ATCC 11170 / ATH 1.1.1 / DSM 467 / LMG 4362 / NCIMB 8255 / S1) TaxID=269796 RepID=Q2RPV8_RHORT|nr:hypothetical protein [Rhodospirillum rubrum]ABC23837.1 hypothetical protein Rru_A3042 [Rhodospirillum rubrum ATCC 11170]AEO49579.1 hypothetical protein F11_15585 [Rhodospirillum rubrum F11]MBK5955510.1 hypothetical protein [Rhodospirillum rubrum]QXG79785.1 S1 family peptidase [Rhodospirillum rubrum]HCF17138.1 hypothetical protein [Rhodospirillum rubrum]